MKKLTCLALSMSLTFGLFANPIIPEDSTETVALYSSTDLVHWKNENTTATITPSQFSLSILTMPKYNLVVLYVNYKVNLFIPASKLMFFEPMTQAHKFYRLMVVR